jgi:Na+-transporting methylmalonyl-CoA/oxaloacetate decarboxylase gamma subunit
MLFFWLLMAIVAVSLVFLVIIGVSVTAIMKKMCAAQETPPQRDEPQGVAVQMAPVSAASAPSEDEDEIVAVITAAVAAICGGPARIASITPSSDSARSSGNMWRSTGRLQNFEGFSNV